MTEGVKQRIRKILLRCADWVMNIFLGAVALCVLWFVAQLFGFASFHIPTDSMMPTIMPGDNILVDKTYMGARIFDFFDASEGKQVKIRRTPGRKHIKSGDIIVFNFPYSDGWDSIAMDIRKYYMKRCVAVPGDTVVIRDCQYFVNGLRFEKDYDQADRLCRFLDINRDNPEEISRHVFVRAFPNDSTVPWTIRDFGPLTVPARGTRIEMDTENAAVYRNYIEWETGGRISVSNDSVFLDGVLLTGYEFDMDYYFVGGDNVFNSQDSRYFGLLPEPFIVGKASMIWKSVDRRSGRMRKERIFKAL